MEQMQSGPCIAMEVAVVARLRFTNSWSQVRTNERPVESLREICGPHDPAIGMFLALEFLDVIRCSALYSQGNSPQHHSRRDRY